MACVFVDFRKKWSVYFRGRARGAKVQARPVMRRKALALMQQKGLNPSQLARRLKVPPRLIYQWQKAEKKQSIEVKSSKKPCFYPVSLEKSKVALSVHTPRGYELQGLDLSCLREWIEQGVL